MALLRRWAAGPTPGVSPRDPCPIPPAALAALPLVALAVAASALVVRGVTVPRPGAPADAVVAAHAMAEVVARAATGVVAHAPVVHRRSPEPGSDADRCTCPGESG